MGEHESGDYIVAGTEPESQRREYRQGFDSNVCTVLSRVLYLYIHTTVPT